jgi:hypothetical protein
VRSSPKALVLGLLVIVAAACGDGSQDRDFVACIGGLYDSYTGLCWQDPPDDTLRTWDDAVAYCDGLALDGCEDWHLPTLDELRSLIRGCPATATGGSCGATDICLAEECWSSACQGCPDAVGPGTDGDCWPSELGGDTEWPYWSSSSFVPGDSPRAWYVWFNHAQVAYHANANATYVRCVRPGP